jgi:polyisoprenoid-binding protein YceI
MTGVKSLVAMLALIALAAGARAQGVLVDKSEIAFTMKQMGVKFDGRFRKWKADVVFEPQQLATSKAVFDVDLASIDLASSESEQEAKGPLWFDTAKFPVAHFASTVIRDLGGGRYEIAGKLLRMAEARFPIRRLDYRIGQGEWADTAIVDNDVVVRARIALGTSP